MKKYLLLLIFSLFYVSISFAQTTVTVASSATMSNILRVGMNLNFQVWYGDANFMQNMFDDPGFEPNENGDIFYVNSGATSSGFTVSNDTGEATGFWNGAPVSVRVGASAGDTFNVGTFTSGGTFTCSPSCPTLNSGDSITIVQTSPTIQAGMAAGNWVPEDSSEVISTAQFKDGVSSLQYDVSGGGSKYVQFRWDTQITTGGVCSNDNVTPCVVANATADCGSSNTCKTAPYIPFHSVVGAYEITLWALGSGTSTGTPTVAITLQRIGGGTNISHTFTLTNDGAWHQYTYTFTGTDVAADAQNELLYTMTASNGSAETGAKIYVDDVYLGRNEPSASGFRDEVINTLNAIAPGSVRYMAYYMLDTDDPGFEGPSGCSPGATAVGGCDYQHGGAGTSTANNTWAFAAQDTYALANAVGAIPWVSIPNTFNDADLKKFIDNACTAIATYGFSQFWVEQSNEDWNGAGPGAKYVGSGGTNSNYGREAGRNFSIMSTEATSDCSANASKFHYVAGNQVCNDGVWTKTVAGATAAGYSIPNTSQYGTDDAPYYPVAGTIPSETGSNVTQAATYAALFFGYPPTTWGSSGCAVTGDLTTLGSNQTMAVYEQGPNAQGGTSSTEERYLSQAGFPSAAWMAQNWLMETQAGVPIQNTYEMSQIEFSNSPLWGTVHDLDSDFGPTFPHLRPIALSQELVNTAMVGNYYSTSGSPSGVYVNVFKNGSNWSAAAVNTNTSTSAITIDFGTGTVPTVAKTIFYTNSIADNNENSNDVYIGCLSGSSPCTGGLSASGQNVTLTIPAESVVALTSTSAAYGGGHIGGHGLF